MHVHASCLDFFQDPLAESQRVELGRRAIAADDFHDALVCASKPAWARGLLFLWPVACHLRPACSILQPVFAATGNGRFRLAVLRERDACRRCVAPCFAAGVGSCEVGVELEREGPERGYGWCEPCGREKNKEKQLDLRVQANWK